MNGRPPDRTVRKLADVDRPTIEWEGKTPARGYGGDSLTRQPPAFLGGFLSGLDTLPRCVRVSGKQGQPGTEVV